MPLAAAKCRSQRGNVRCLVPDSGLSNIGIIFFAELAAWCVDHQMNLAVLDMIHNVGTAFMSLNTYSDSTPCSVRYLWFLRSP